MSEWISEATWEATKAEIAARGKIDRDFPIPDEPRWQRLNDRQRAWGLAYFRSGGDSRVANDAAGFQTPAHLTLYRFVGDDTPAVSRMRTYIAALNDSFKGSVVGGAEASFPAEVIPATDPIPEASTQRPSPPTEEIVTQPPVYVPAEIVPVSEQVDEQEMERDTEKAKKVWRSAASYTPGDFMVLMKDEAGKTIDWDWDFDKLKRAPAGVLKNIVKDGRGQTKVEFESAVGAAKELANHYKPKENESGRVDIRTMVVQVLQSGDPSARYRLDQLAKEAADRLRLDREKKQLSS